MAASTILRGAQSTGNIGFMGVLNMDIKMKQAMHPFGRAGAFISLLFVSGIVLAQQVFRIDGSSDESVERSYKSMFESLDEGNRVKLSSAIVQLNMAGVSSASEMLADPALRSPGPVRIKDRIAGLSAAEIIEVANKTATVTMLAPGQEPGVPADLLTPLPVGESGYSLESTQWHFVTDTDGHMVEKTLRIEPGGKLAVDSKASDRVSEWEQSANEVRFFINDRYAVSRGKFIDSDHMQGTAGNKLGTTWTWTATRM